MKTLERLTQWSVNARAPAQKIQQTKPQVSLNPSSMCAVRTGAGARARRNQFWQGSRQEMERR